MMQIAGGKYILLIDTFILKQDLVLFSLVSDWIRQLMGDPMVTFHIIMELIRLKKCSSIAERIPKVCIKHLCVVLVACTIFKQCIWF